MVVVLSFSARLGHLSAAGALIWFGARVAHAVLFMAGISGWRTVAYLASLVGLALMLVAMLF